MTSIEWTDETWNPVTGCDRISPGCAHCYALTLAKRLKAMGHPGYQVDGGPASGPGFGVTLHPDRLDIPLRWRTPRRVFVNSMSDLFHEAIPDRFIDAVFAVMMATPRHTYQILTKRPRRMRLYLTAHNRYSEICMAGGGEDFVGQLTVMPVPNAWLGTSVEYQRQADERIPQLHHTPAAVRFLSVEPMLGPMDLSPYLSAGAADWVIVGGESGPGHRPFDPDWARSIVAQCRAAGVAAFVKQLGGARPGTKLEDLPEDLRIREYPTSTGPVPAQ